MGKLSVLGLGLRCPQHTTRRAMQALKEADQLFFISDNLDKQNWLRQLNPNFVDLMTHYAKGKPRRDTYQEMADRVLESLRKGHHAALISYGHPLVFCDPSRLALEQTRAEGFPVEILPGISSIDCLLADLRVDTQNYGLQIYEGHDLLLHAVQVDPNCSQVVFQVPSLGDNTGGWTPGRFRGFIQALAETLARTFGEDHPAVLYFGSNSPDRPHHIDSVTLGSLARAPMVSEYTLWVPPVGYEMLPFETAAEGPAELELVGLGLHPDDLTQEVEALGDSPQIVAYPGHPCAQGAIARARQAHREGVRFRIRPGISWEDGCYCSVPLDPGLLGFQWFPGGKTFPLPVNLATLVGLPCALPGGQYWGPQGFSQELQPDSLALYLPGPDPRPLDDGPFQRALQLSAVERLLAFLETTSLELPGGKSCRLWLHQRIQTSGRVLREALEQGQLPLEDWVPLLLKNPQHPLAPHLFLKLRCEEVLASGMPLAPLQAWLEQTS